MTLEILTTLGACALLAVLGLVLARISDEHSRARRVDYYYWLERSPFETKPAEPPTKPESIQYEFDF